MVWGGRDRHISVEFKTSLVYMASSRTARNLCSLFLGLVTESSNPLLVKEYPAAGVVDDVHGH